MQPPEAFGSIHEFGPDSKGQYHTDEEGEALLGFYFQITDAKGVPGGMIGPYTSNTDCEEACQKAWDQGDY